MLASLRACVVLFVLLSLLTGIAYPLVVTVAAQIALPRQANGSLIHEGDRLVGSELIGQNFDDARYFWGRPSATDPAPYNAASSGGSNLGPTNPDFLKVVRERVAAIRKAHPDQTDPVPVELVTASGSGLDPHISPVAAKYQVARIAKARGISEDAVRKIVAKYTEKRTADMLGEPRVNVLRLNLALDDGYVEQK
jgi:K+-transporting ATPase ATPase C chain